MKNSLLIWQFLFAIIFLPFNWCWGQTNPETANLPFSFTGSASLPTSMAIHRFGTSAAAIPTTRTTSDGNADLPFTTNNNSGGYMIEGTSGVDGLSILASSSQSAGAILVEFSTINKQNITLDWVAWTKLDQSNYTNSIALQYRVGDSGTWINVDTPASTVYSTSTIGRSNGVNFTANLPLNANNQNIVQVRWIYWSSAGTSGSRDRLGIDEIFINGDNTQVSPAINSSVSSLTGFNYVHGAGPSAEQSFTLTGTNLTNIVELLTGSNFEISETPGSGFSDYLSITPIAGSVNKTIYVRMKAGLAINPNITDDVLVSSTGASDVYISLSGSVAPPQLLPPVATSGNGITNTSFIANWDPIPGATSYAIDVSTNPNFATTVLASDLFISEYVEGSSYNKYIEIFNGTGASIDLSNYKLRLFSNGATTSTDSTLSGILANNSTIVYKNSSAIVYTGQATVNSSVCNFSGNDALALYKISSNEYIDIFGRIGEDPGPNWSSGSFSTINKTLVRKENVAAGVSINPSSGFPTLSTEWNQFDIDTVSNLGSHTFNSSAPSFVTGYNNLNVGNTNAYTITGLSPGTTYYYRVRAINSNETSANSNVISITTDGPIKYINNSWSNGSGPDATKDVILLENYSGPSFEAKDLTIDLGKTLTVNNTVTVNGVLTNNGSIVVNDSGNLVQNTGSTYTGSGSFTLNRNTTSAANKYVFWSSPVAGQNLFSIYGTGNTPQYVTIYNSTTDTYTAVANPAIAVQGVGYSVKVPATVPVSFSGTPNNGDVPVTLNRTANANGNTWNLIGNPYPSNINLVSLYNGGNNGIDSSIYLWDNISASGTTQIQNATTWGIFNAASSTWGSSGLSTSGNHVKAGQGFIVKALATGTTTFTNSMRNANTANFVNKNANSTEGKYWLKLTNATGQQFQTAVTYGQGATNGIEAYDSKVMSLGADAIYTYTENTKLAIQGRAAFVNTDVVTIGNKFASATNYNISLAGTEGIFANGQAIYLRDKHSNTYTNLQNGSYNFTALSGEIQDRFEVVYQPQSVLATSELKAEQVEVYVVGENLEVKAPKNMTEIAVYDSSGRLVYTQYPKSTVAKIALKTKGMYMLRIQIGKEIIAKKIVK